MRLIHKLHQFLMFYSAMYHETFSINMKEIQISTTKVQLLQIQ